MKEIGYRIRRARKRARIGLRVLAREVGCSPSFISLLEHGLYKGGFSGEQTRAIMERLGIMP